MVHDVYIKFLLTAPSKIAKFLINFILAYELFAKGSQSLENCVSVNHNNICEKLVSSLKPPIAFDERFKVTLVPFCI